MSVSRRQWLRREFLGIPFGAYAAYAAAPRLIAAQSDLPKLAGPSVDAVCRGLNAAPEPSYAIAWVAFVDDPDHRSRRELWRVVDKHKLDRQLVRYYSQIVSGLTAGERVIAADLLNLAKERRYLLRPPPPSATWYSVGWMYSAFALSCIARVGSTAPDIAERFQAEHGKKSENICTRVVSAHLSQAECNDLRTLGLPDDMSHPIWQRVLALLYGFGKCSWLGDGALRQIYRVSLEHAVSPDSWHCGLFVLSALGERGRFWLRRLDRAVATDVDNGNVVASTFPFTMSHALAALAAGCDNGRALMEAACKLTKRALNGNLVPPFILVAERAVGMMTDDLAREVAAVLLIAPIGLSAFSAVTVLLSAGPHASGCVGPLLAFLSKGDQDVQRRRFAALAMMFALDGGSREAIEAHLVSEKDECVRKVLRNGLEYASTLSRELCPSVGLRGDEIELIFEDGASF